MRKLLFLIYVCLPFMNADITFAQSSSQKEVTIQAELIQKYVKQHKINIEKFISKYEIVNNNSLNLKLRELETFQVLLYKIEKRDYTENEAKIKINQILSWIKRINEEFKITLTIEKNNFEKRLERKKAAYSKIWKKLSIQLDRINIGVAKKIFQNKTTLSQKDLIIKKHLLSLDNESKKLENIGNINFRSQNEIRQAFIRILKNIKREMQGLKSTLKNS